MKNSITQYCFFFRSIAKTVMCLTIILAITSPSIATAEIFVDRAIVRLGTDSGNREDVTVINNGSEVGYVQVEVFEVRNPGTGEEERVRVTDPDAIKLIASPGKLMIPANSQKLVRIVNLDTVNNRENIYRINITPVLPPLQEEEGSVVRIVVAYQLLVIVDPTQLREELDIQRSMHRLTVNNTGNTNVLFSDGKQCSDEGKNCIDIPAHRVYPGNTWAIDLEKDLPATFKITSYKGIREITTQ